LRAQIQYGPFLFGTAIKYKLYEIVHLTVAECERSVNMLTVSLWKFQLSVVPPYLTYGKPSAFY